MRVGARPATPPCSHWSKSVVVTTGQLCSASSGSLVQDVTACWRQWAGMGCSIQAAEPAHMWAPISSTIACSSTLPTRSCSRWRAVAVRMPQ